MCTAATYKTKDFYFGRTLDYEFSYGDEVTITPRNFEFKFREVDDIKSHYAIIGMAFVTEDYPLYYDAINEKGLAIAGLNFVGNAHYKEKQEGKDNVAQFELIPWILSQCSNVNEARNLIEKMNVLNTPFSDKLPLASLHWIISDSTQSITVESVIDGIKIYDNPVGVLTNNPTFDFHVLNLSNYLNITNQEVNNIFLKDFDLAIFGKGLQGRGLPGDSSPCSRFIKATFLLNNIDYDDDYDRNLSQMMHVLNNVSTLVGEVKQSDGSNEYTIYSSMYETTTSTLFLRTYHHYAILKYNLDLNNVDNDDINVINIPKDIVYQNIK